MIHTFTFPNGFRLIHETPHSSLNITAIQVFCKVGSINEHDHTRGFSHFIEHMCFKGTKTRPLSKDILKTYDEIGAYFNATTDKTYTNYVVKCQDSYVKECIMVLSDMLLNSVFYKTEYEKEKKVVIEESFRIENDGESIISDMVDKKMYAGTPYENPIDTLAYHRDNSLQYTPVIEYYKKYYRPENMVISIISHVPMSTFIKILEKSYFTKPFLSSPEKSHAPLSKLQTTASHIMPRAISSIEQCPIFFLKKRQELKTIQLAVGFRTCSQYSTDKYTLNLLKNALGGYMMSKLFVALREENGLTYTSSVYTKYFDILGDFTIFTETSPEKIMVNNTTTNKSSKNANEKQNTKGRAKTSTHLNDKGVFPVIIDLIHELQTKGITLPELQTAKKNLKGSIALEEEDSDTACFLNGSRMLLYDTPNDSLVSYSDYYDTYYKHLTVKDVNDVIKKYIKLSNMVVCMLGPQLPKLEELTSIVKESLK
jgi:predicted Zn-dependent peptidase